MSGQEKTAGERRRFWFSLTALTVVLPAAILVHGWESFIEWRTADAHDPVTVERGAEQDYAGATWRMTGLDRLPGRISGETVVLAQFEAVIDDPEKLAQGPCLATLTDAEGRRWKPRFTSEPVVRSTHPEAADRQRCVSFGLDPITATLAMAETFVVPDTAEDLALEVTVAGARPMQLVFR